MIPVILAVDPARSSGWGIVRGGELLGYGIAKTAVEIEAVVRAAMEADGPLVAVGESWESRGRQRSARVLTGLGAAWGRWAYALEIAGHPKRRTLRVSFPDWRRAVLGTSRMKGSVAKRYAVAWARTRWGVRVGDDIAEALCIAAWAERAQKVAAVLPPGARMARPARAHKVAATPASATLREVER